MTLNPDNHQPTNNKVDNGCVEATSDTRVVAAAISTAGAEQATEAKAVSEATATPAHSTSQSTLAGEAGSEFGVDAEIDRLGLSHPEIGQTPLLPPREPLGARIASFMGRHHTLLFVLSVIVLWAITTLPPLWREEPYERGEVASHDILAPHSQMLFDRQETLDRQQRAATLVPPSYDPDASAQERALSRLRLLIDSARKASAASDIMRKGIMRKGTARVGAMLSPQSALGAGATTELRIQRRVAQQLNGLLNKPLSPLTVRQVLLIRRTRWDDVARAARGAIGAVYIGGQLRSDVEDDLAGARARIGAALRRADVAHGLNAVESAVAAAFAQRLAQLPNLVVNDLKTERARQMARNGVRRVYLQIEANTPVVRAGEIITDERWAQMQDLDIITPRLEATMALARLGLCILLISLSAGFLSYFHPRLLHHPTQLWLAAAVPLVFLLSFRFLLHLPHAETAALPVAATAAMLLTILLDARVGILAGFLVASLCTVMARADMALFLTVALSAWAGTLGVANINSRGQLVRAGLLLTVINAALAAMLGVFREAPGDEIISLMMWSAASGVFSTVATAGLAMFLERPFGITTHLRLLELMSPEEVVMRRMQAEAPGTYTHSLMVATLSEAAAKSIEAADPLLCRVAGLYHDIGKLRRPHCFVENQSGENIHDRLSPQLSALVILAHVKDGLELGRALRLPQPVLDIIAQHHGTGLISYFYERAVQQTQTSADNHAPQSTLATFGRRAGDDTATQNRVEIERSQTIDAATVATTSVVLPDESLFRYAGPRPQNKEAAIVMLADSIEASARSLSEPTPERVQTHIQDMIARRLQEGELSDSDLTLRDLQKIESSFAHVMRGVLHHRIEYPDPTRDASQDLAGEVSRTASKRDTSRRDRHNAKRKREREPKLRRHSDRLPTPTVAEPSVAEPAIVASADTPETETAAPVVGNDASAALKVHKSAIDPSLSGTHGQGDKGIHQNGHDVNGHSASGHSASGHGASAMRSETARHS